jgi:hypothetical protein
MGKLYRQCCNGAFALKALIAAGLAFSLLAYYVREVILLYNDLEITPLPSIFIPEAGSAGAELCFYSSKTKARLEPPEGTFLFGFSLQWDRDLPELFAQRMEIYPSLVK